jgi:hypothetical protein
MPAAATAARADDVGDSVVDGEARHLEGGGEVGGPVVDAGKEMVVQVNHGLRVASSPN